MWECRYCGQTRIRRQKTECPDSPNSKHDWVDQDELAEERKRERQRQWKAKIASLNEEAKRHDLSSAEGWLWLETEDGDTWLKNSMAGQAWLNTEDARKWDNYKVACQKQNAKIALGFKIVVPIILAFVYSIPAYKHFQAWNYNVIPMLAVVFGVISVLQVYIQMWVFEDDWGDMGVIGYWLISTGVIYLVPDLFFYDSLSKTESKEFIQTVFCINALIYLVSLICAIYARIQIACYGRKKWVKYTSTNKVTTSPITVSFYTGLTYSVITGMVLAAAIVSLFYDNTAIIVSNSILFGTLVTVAVYFIVVKMFKLKKSAFKNQENADFSYSSTHFSYDAKKQAEYDNNSGQKENTGEEEGKADKDEEGDEENDDEDDNSYEAYCEELGLEPDGLTMDVLKNRYKLLVKQYHPDRIASHSEKERKQAEDKIKRINAAYDYIEEVLMSDS
jgi:hypothetical protein